MKIEAGKWYKMRNGEAAYIVGLHPDSQCWVGTYSFGSAMWVLDGKHGGYGPSSFDLISVLEEPKEVDLPKKLRLFNPELTLGQKGEMKASLCNVEISYDRINQLIDYCKSLQTRMEELER